MLLELYQEQELDCFHTAVACVTGLAKAAMPQVYPVYLPNDLYKVEWKRWAFVHGVDVYYTEEEPEGISVAAIEVDHPDRVTQAHAVVWEEGSIIWDPARYRNFGYGDVMGWVKMEVMSE